MPRCHCLQVQYLVAPLSRISVCRAYRAICRACQAKAVRTVVAETEAGLKNRDLPPTLNDRRLIAPQRGLIPPHCLTIAIRILGVAIPAVHRFVPPRVHCEVVRRLAMLSAGRGAKNLEEIQCHLRFAWCVVWCDVVWCGVVWCGVVWCGDRVAHSQ
jgi:hypothetical protein